MRKFFENQAVADRARHWSWGALLLAFPIASMLLSGCSDGTVVANGRVLVEGQPSKGGRLTLSPVGGGPRAFSLVTDDGQFALRSRSDSLGAKPGTYLVSYDRPIDPATRESLKRELRGQLSPDDFTEVFTGPRDKPLVIPEQGSDELTIDIRHSAGWTRDMSD
ncbi:MAG: hypothetical protein AB7G28_00505 [Pirellulales bacterium]